jgi:hypothetical protein
MPLCTSVGRCRWILRASAASTFTGHLECQQAKEVWKTYGSTLPEGQARTPDLAARFREQRSATKALLPPYGVVESSKVRRLGNNVSKTSSERPRRV